MPGRTPSLLLAAALVALAAVVAPAPARADLFNSLTVDVSDAGGGAWLYQYTLTNETGSTLPIIRFALSIDEATADIQQVTVPTGWDSFFTVDSTTIQFDVYIDQAILPGNSATFSFTSLLGPVLSDYYVIGVLSYPPHFEFNVNYGSILAPGVAVPEPATLALLGVGLAGLAAARFRIREGRFSTG